MDLGVNMVGLYRGSVQVHVCLLFQCRLSRVLPWFATHEGQGEAMLVVGPMRYLSSRSRMHGRENQANPSLRCVLARD
jgi:hypothetical protein